jgi:hypothetical protein
MEPSQCTPPLESFPKKLETNYLPSHIDVPWIIVDSLLKCLIQCIGHSQAHN